LAHVLSGMKIGYNTIFQWAYSLYVFMGFTMHLLRCAAHCYRAIGGAVACYYTRFIHHYFIVLDDDCIGSTKVYGYFLCQKIKNAHACCV
jgi:hypothetical protein